MKDQHQCCSEHCFSSERWRLLCLQVFSLYPAAAVRATGVLQQYFDSGSGKRNENQVEYQMLSPGHLFQNAATAAWKL